MPCHCTDIGKVPLETRSTVTPETLVALEVSNMVTRAPSKGRVMLSRTSTVTSWGGPPIQKTTVRLSRWPPYVSFSGWEGYLKYQPELSTAVTWRLYIPAG